LQTAGASVISEKRPSSHVPSVNVSRKALSQSRLQDQDRESLFATKVRLDRNVLKASKEELAKIKRVVSSSLKLQNPLDPDRTRRYL